MSGESKGIQGEIGNSAGDTAGTGAGSGSGSSVASAVVVTGLASDQAGMASNAVTPMVNAWGIVSYQGAFWIANNATGKVSIVDGKGVAATGKIASNSIDLGEGITGVAVTDLAKDDTTSFQIHGDTACAPAQLIFAREDGKLIGFNADMSATAGFTLVDRSGSDASYLGVAVLHGAKGPMVLAADFHNARVDVFDANFSLVENFKLEVPSLPADFAPFNVMVIGDKIFVAFAKQDAAKADEVAGPGLGLIAAFDSSGKLLGTVKSDLLNAPWGMAMSRDFTPFPNALLVGNFGDGHITAIDTTNFTVLGQLMDATGKPVVLEGLWGLAFGVDVTNLMAGGLYFASGPGDEMHGLFGVISAAPTTPSM
ncbi:MAG TPA: TIGR03118 family protein [Kofleriaceae bacterium]|nr:TIGR03118 family protein [Kofleriaceae bacterium]